MRIEPRQLQVALAVLLGVFMGVGVFTFHFAEGLSYFSSDPVACVNCHIMNDEFASWQKGPHHGEAKCVDCHLPHEIVPKLVAKGENGYHHSKGFTLQDFHEPIMIKPRNAEILQENCLRCHGDFVYWVLADSKTAEDGPKCVHCHREAGHGARA